jgi:hypothetical protein
MASKDKMESEARIDVLEQRKIQLEVEVEEEKNLLAIQVEKNTQSCLQIEELTCQISTLTTSLSQVELQLENEKSAFQDSQSTLKVIFPANYPHCCHSNLKLNLPTRWKP